MSGYSRGRPTSPVPLECKVYVGNLPSGASRSELEEAFAYYGPVKNVWVARNPPGFAFVMFEDKHDAEDAVQALDDRTICGNRIRCEMSSGESRRRGDRGYRGGGGGGYGGRRGGMRDNERCYECGERGHFARDCRRRGGTGGGSRRRYSVSRSRSRSRSRSPRRRSSPRRSSPRRSSPRRSSPRRSSPRRYISHSRSRSRSRSRS